MRRFLLTTAAATAVMLGGCIVITDGHSSSTHDGDKVRYIGGDTTAQLVLAADDCAQALPVSTAKSVDERAEPLPGVELTPDADRASTPQGGQLCNLGGEG